ncbi:helix-turn-helix domain-containing protein [Variovorax sp. J22R115]|uniref:helix-turn-helix domain-containing protein n=1 Tax=Variovorax sp. J22R115 TaxID=3053509 RepID=UPI0025785394|nr:helix-turn-helix transcriptional regulator [Variovorax sp. J22R115]MDM0051394.1 helix-turn-helix transcriptional regulator [Variovorax sp. J22R115]
MELPRRAPRFARTDARVDETRITQSQVANRLKRPQSFVSKYENGERQLDVVEFMDVCKALGVSPAALINQLL